ncbi:MAG: type II toxin-antitoxin system VapC family toxin [Actinomycetia bacterium]|nr:type II toxin-antitoxin system VapC family toxin [Actinomycetes bacterium]
MTPNAEVLLLDTSAALALIDLASPRHQAVLAVARGHRLGLSGHAAFEVLSLATRLPFPHRLSGADAARLITTNFPDTRYLDEATATTLPSEFARLGVLGGSVYDGLVAACARTHGLTLLTCDRRARPTYDLLGVSYRLIDSSPSS